MTCHRFDFPLARFIVLDAFSSQDALDAAKEYPGRIDILVSGGTPGYEIALFLHKPFRFSALLDSLRQLQSGN